ncbi:HYC_CC_PP family protein [Maribacter arcticus]|jgi:hypothetical protein|uniref:HYC_CC_PP family protein n=1 Tax=Maribacter arcticus TaxID=561365 RepID=UPI0030D92088|tara:strand:- start:3414 stop:3833 length:420 start_codon:yes stop_codon:yes gene_type:complete
MKQFIHKSMAVFMAAVVLMTTMSFAVDMHYCGDTLVDFSFVHQAKSCGMEKTQVIASCETSTVSEKSCCTDKQLIKEGNEVLKASFDHFTLEQQVFIASFTFSFINLFEGTESNEVPFIDYAPPFLKQNVQVLHQTFLI